MTHHFVQWKQRYSKFDLNRLRGINHGSMKLLIIICQVRNEASLVSHQGGCCREKVMHITEPLSLTHWGRVTHICVVKLTITVSDNGLSPRRRQAIIWTNAGILLIGPLGTNFIEILIGIQTFSFKKMHLKMSSAKWRPFCLGLNVF